MADPPVKIPPGAIVWVALSTGLAASAFIITDTSIRVGILRGVLVLSAFGECLGGFFQVFRARRVSKVTGRPYAPAYHGAVQDFGFYNFAVALLFGFAALDPESNKVVIGVAIALYAVHGGTHLLRYMGVYYGGETRVSTRPPEMELRDGMPLITAGTGLLLFFP